MMNGPFLEALRRRPLLLDTGMVGLLALLSLPASRDFLTVDSRSPPSLLKETRFRAGNPEPVPS